jgi:hypothetical protein
VCSSPEMQGAELAVIGNQGADNQGVVAAGAERDRRG